MKLQGYIRLVNVTRYNYIMDYISLLLCPAMQLYDHARQMILCGVIQLPLLIYNTYNISCASVCCIMLLVLLLVLTGTT